MKRAPEFHWSSANARERGEMVRSHRTISKDEVCRLFNLTLGGYTAIMSGDEWSPEFSTAPHGELS